MQGGAEPPASISQNREAEAVGGSEWQEWTRARDQPAQEAQPGCPMLYRVEADTLPTASSSDFVSAVYQPMTTLGWTNLAEVALGGPAGYWPAIL